MTFDNEIKALRAENKHLRKQLSFARKVTECLVVQRDSPERGTFSVFVTDSSALCEALAELGRLHG